MARRRAARSRGPWTSRARCALGSGPPPTEAPPSGGRRIGEVYGRVDYVYQGGASLMERGVYDAALLEAEYLARVAPRTLSRKIADGYLRGMPEEAPGVIALNMRAA